MTLPEGKAQPVAAMREGELCARTVEACAKIADLATERHMQSAGFIKIDGRYKAQSVGSPEDAQSMATAAAKSNATFAVAAAIRAQLTTQDGAK